MDEFSGRIFEKAGGPGQRRGSWSNVLVSIGGKFQSGGNDTTREAFFEEKKSYRRRTILFTDNEMSKGRFTEELSFETEVAQAAALSAILFFSLSFSSLNSSDKSNFSKSFEISSKT